MLIKITQMLDIQNLSDERLRVYKSISPKISRSPFGFEITYLRALSYQEFDFWHENGSGMRTESLHVDFAKISILALAPASAYLGVSKYQELSFDYENSFGSHFESLQVDFWKCVNLFTWSRDCKFRGHSISENPKMSKKNYQD